MAPNLPTVRRAGLNTSVYGWHKVNPANNTAMSQWNRRLYFFQYLNKSQWNRRLYFFQYTSISHNGTIDCTSFNQADSEGPVPKLYWYGLHYIRREYDPCIHSCSSFLLKVLSLKSPMTWSAFGRAQQIEIHTFHISTVGTNFVPALYLPQISRLSNVLTGTR